MKQKSVHQITDRFLSEAGNLWGSAITYPSVAV